MGIKKLTAIQVIARFIEKGGQIRISDIGCGTNVLFTFIRWDKSWRKRVSGHEAKAGSPMLIDMLQKQTAKRRHQIVR